MDRPLTRKAGRLLAASLACLALAGLAYAQMSSVCAIVKFEILQKVTLERLGFDARLEMTNNLTSTSLSDLSISVFIEDMAGNPKGDLFFVKVSQLAGTNALDGSGVVQAGSTADIHWLIVPSTGAGGSYPTGMRYQARAQISYSADGIPQTLNTGYAPFTVTPQPQLYLEYVLPRDVVGIDPFSGEGQPEPFYLGVRVSNRGYGPAQNLTIDSGQPRIVDNKEALPVEFKIIGTFAGNTTIPDTLSIPFGDLAPDSAKLASWIMTATFSGRFVDFNASFTHDPGLGGAQTSLIQGVETYTLVKDVLVDLPGRDSQFDFLVDTAQTPDEPVPNAILESDQTNPLTVQTATGAVSGSLSTVNPVMTLAAPPAQGFQYLSAPDPTRGNVHLVSVVRSDGKVLNPRNFWQGTPYYNPAHETPEPRLYILDFDPTGDYSLYFSTAQLDSPPVGVQDLAASAGASPGEVELRWTSPGEDGAFETLYNGTYLIHYSTSPTSGADPASAQVGISTTTDPLLPQAYSLDLDPDRAYYFVLWTRDQGGHVSEVSNTADAVSRAGAPANVRISEVLTVSAAVSWQAGANPPGTGFEAELSTDGFETVAEIVPAADEASFGSLAPNTTYWIRVAAIGGGGLRTYSETLSLVTLASPPESATLEIVGSSLATAGFTPVSPASLAAAYELSASSAGFDGGTVPSARSTDSSADSLTVHGLRANTAYEFRLASLNWAGVPNYVPLGPGRTGEGPPDSPRYATIGASEAAIAWDPVASSGYRVEASTADFFGGSVVSADTADGNASSLILSGLAANTTYFVRAGAVWDSGVRFASLPPVVTTASPPEGLSVVDITDAGAAGNWLPSDARGYILEASTDPDFSGLVISSSTPDPHSVTLALSGLIPDTTYLIRVGALNHAGAASYSPALTFVTLASPVGDSSMEVFVSSALARWTPPADPGGYVLRASTAPDFTGDVLSAATADPDAGELALSGLSPNTRYAFQVGRLNHAGIASYAPHHSLVTLAAEPDSASVSAVSTDSATVAFDPVDSAGYVLEASNADFDGTGNIYVSSTTDAMASSLTAAGLHPNTTYFFRLSSLNRSGIPSGRRVEARSTLAEVPSDAAVSSVGSSEVSVEWTPLPPSPSRATSEGYMLAACAMPDFSGGLHISSTSDPSAGLLSVGGLVADTVYYLRFGSLNWSGEANPVELGSARMSLGPPGSPAFTAVLATGLSVGFSPVPAQGYRLEASEAPDFSGTLVESSSASPGDDSLSLTGMTPNTTYYVRLGAVWPDEVLYAALGPVSTLAAAPNPADPSLVSISSTSATLRWQALPASPREASAEGYILEASAYADFREVASSSSTAAVGLDALTLSGLTPNRGYFFRVGSLNWDGRADYTALGEGSTFPGDPTLESYDSPAPPVIAAAWSIPRGEASGFVLEVSTAAAFSSLAASSSTSDGSAAGLEVSGLSPNTTYHLRAASLGLADQRSYSSAAVQVTRANPPDQDVLGVFRGSITVSWNWNGNPAGTLYMADLYVPSGATFAVIYSTRTTAPTASISDFAPLPNTTHYVRIKARNFAGVDSEYRTAQLFVGLRPPLLAGFDRANDSITVRLDPRDTLPGADFTFEVSTEDGFAVLLASVTHTSPSATFGGLAPFTTYYFRADAALSGENTGFTDLGGVFLAPTEPPAPAQPVFSGVATRSMDVNWLPNGHLPGTLYDVQLSTTADFSAILRSSQTYAFGAGFSGLDLNRAHHARVAAYLAWASTWTAFAPLGSVHTPGRRARSAGGRPRLHGCLGDRLHGELVPGNGGGRLQPRRDRLCHRVVPRRGFHGRGLHSRDHGAGRGLRGA
ncbi:MAG: fibronectin type III domain-containing protein [Elusimicrobiota bacterium]